MCFSGSASFLRSHLLTHEPKQALSALVPALSQQHSVFLTFPFTSGAANTRRKALQTPVCDAKAACATASCHQMQGMWHGDASQHPLLLFPVSGSFHLMRIRGSCSLSALLLLAGPGVCRAVCSVLPQTSGICQGNGFLQRSAGRCQPLSISLPAGNLQQELRLASSLGDTGGMFYHLRLACVEDAIRNTTGVFCLSKTLKITFFNWFSLFLRKRGL